MPEVVITGTGVISALRHDVPAFWPGLCAGEVATHEAPWSSPGHFAWWAGIRGFDPARWADPAVVSGSDQFTLFTLAAAGQALAQARLDEPDPRRTGVSVGTSMGGHHPGRPRGPVRGRHRGTRHHLVRARPGQRVRLRRPERLPGARRLLIRCP